MMSPPDSDRRKGPDRRSVLENAALLAIEVLDLRDINETEGRLLTRALRELELLRTPTAPDVQRQTAASHLRDLHREIVALSARRGETLQRFAELLDHLLRDSGYSSK